MALPLKKVALSLFGFLVFSTPNANAQQQSYTEEFVRNYVNTCTAGRGSAVRKVCECTIRKIQQEYTFAEYRQLDQQLKAGTQPPPTLIEILRSCQINPEGS